MQRKSIYRSLLQPRRNKTRNGRPKKLRSDQLNQMLNPSEISMREYPWPVQIEHFELNVSRRTLQRAMHQRSPRAGRFKMAKVRSISNRNKELRVQYGREHQDHTVWNFFQYVHWSDEAHFDPDQTYGG